MISQFPYYKSILPYDSLFNLTFTFSYNPWVCLFSSALCVAIMFWMSWLYAAITIGVLVVLGLYVFWANPEANWGSSTQGQVFVSALKHVKEVTGISIFIKTI